MLNKFLPKSKRSQVSEFMSWMVATIIIFIFIVVFVFVASAMTKAKSVTRDAVSVFEEEEDISYGWIGTKIKLAFELNSGNREVISTWVKNEIPQEQKG